MIVSKDIEFYRSRLLNLADILEKLLEDKEKHFKHSTYIDTDDICNTSACIAGWAVILYTEEGRKISDLQKEVFKYFNDDVNKWKYSETKIKLYEFTSNLDWMQLGMETLGLGQKTAEKFFIPQDSFWRSIGVQRYKEGATNRQAALACRYLAATKDLRFRPNQEFNEERMTKFIEKHRSN